MAQKREMSYYPVTCWLLEERGPVREEFSGSLPSDELQNLMWRAPDADLLVTDRSFPTRTSRHTLEIHNRGRLFVIPSWFLDDVSFMLPPLVALLHGEYKINV